MKKFNIFNIIILFLVLLLTACNLKPKTLTEFYEGDLEDVSEITIVDESTGFGKEVTNKEDIDKFLNDIKDTKFIPEENQEPKDDLDYSVNLFEGDKETFQFGSTYVNGNYYYTEPDIHPIIEQLYESIMTNTPDDAIKSFEFAKNIRVIKTFEVNERQIFYVFEGEHEPGTEYFLISVVKVKRNSMWGWDEAMPIGHPDNYIPGYISIKNASAGLNPISEKPEDEWNIIEIPDSEYYIWVEIPDKR